MDKPHPSRRVALTIRCSAKEAEAVKKMASRERRSISAFVMNSLLNRIATHRQIEERLSKSPLAPGGHASTPKNSDIDRVNRVETRKTANRFSRAA